MLIGRGGVNKRQREQKEGWVSRKVAKIDCGQVNFDEGVKNSEKKVHIQLDDF